MGNGQLMIDDSLLRMVDETTVEGIEAGFLPRLDGGENPWQGLGNR